MRPAEALRRVNLLTGAAFLATVGVVVQAGDYALATAVEKLREIAGLPSISTAVPVTFALEFSQ